MAAQHVASALEYARGVVDGVIPAGRYVRLAAQRHLKDLERAAANDPSFPYYFDEAAAERPCKFISMLRHVKGKWAAAGKRFELGPWQEFLVTVLFGWKRRKNGRRRFRVVYWEIPRKNGKSLLAAAIGLYMFLLDGEYGAEVYSGATTEKQAWEVFKPAKQMLSMDEDLRKFTGASVAAKALLNLRDGSKFEPLIGNPGDGSSPSCAIVDEFHEHETPALIDTMETGMGAREQPLLLIITTAGYNIAGPCYEKNEEVRKQLDGGIEVNEELFGCIFSVDSDDDWADPAVLIKANPNYGVSVDEDFLLSQQRQALLNPIYQGKFKTKHLNVWTSVYAGVVNMQHWHLAKDEQLDEAELAGCPSWVAFDMASKSDLSASVRVYRKELGGMPHYYLFATFWLPEAAIEDSGPNEAHYKKWVNQGYLIPTGGATIDSELLTEHLLQDCKQVNPEEFVFDPFNATHIGNKIAENHVTAVEFNQMPANFVVPLDELLTALKDGRIHHDGNPILTWCMSNMVAKPAKKGMISPIKQKAHQKIDGGIAAIMGIGRAACYEPRPESEIRWA